MLFFFIIACTLYIVNIYQVQKKYIRYFISHVLYLTKPLKDATFLLMCVQHGPSYRSGPMGHKN